ncbi:sigma-70 family RNA polymerase sigma factor [Actinoplanes sp. NPDC004185]
MTGTGPDGPLARAFEQQRGRLVAVAHRILGSRTDAEDAVQEAWLRLARQGPDAIDNLAGWLTTVVGRVCVDMLRSRRIRPEAPYDDELPELVVTEDPGAGPEQDALVAESVGLALMVVLDTLGPAERLAFVLHDVFAVPFEEIGEIVGTSGDAAKMLAWRARRKVQAPPRPAADPREQRAVVDAFMAATSRGDFEGLLHVLDPDVTWREHTARGLVVRSGSTEVAARVQRAGRARGTARRVRVNDGFGVAAWTPGGRLRTVMACTVVGGRIAEMESVTDPVRLAGVNLPRPTPAGPWTQDAQGR